MRWPCKKAKEDNHESRDPKRGCENMIHYALNIEPPVEPPEYTCPRCPVCGEEADSYYKDKRGNIVGCPECVQEVTSWET